MLFRQILSSLDLEQQYLAPYNILKIFQITERNYEIYTTKYLIQDIHKVYFNKTEINKTQKSKFMHVCIHLDI